MYVYKCTCRKKKEKKYSRRVPPRRVSAHSTWNFFLFSVRSLHSVASFSLLADDLEPSMALPSRFIANAFTNSSFMCSFFPERSIIIRRSVALVIPTAAGPCPAIGRSRRSNWSLGCDDTTVFRIVRATFPWKKIRRSQWLYRPFRWVFENRPPRRVSYCDCTRVGWREILLCGRYVRNYIIDRRTRTAEKRTNLWADRRCQIESAGCWRRWLLRPRVRAFLRF